jgi:hypothetical protein
MFVCESKCVKNFDNWLAAGSYGPCELCGAVTLCFDIPSTHLKPKVLSKETFTDSFGHVVKNVHNKLECNPPCTIHAHSRHSLCDTPLLWRNDRGIFEHMCQHGIGHPCPDSLNNNDSGIHGCDGCCMKG